MAKVSRNIALLQGFSEKSLSHLQREYPVENVGVVSSLSTMVWVEVYRHGEIELRGNWKSWLHIKEDYVVMKETRLKL